MSDLTNALATCRTMWQTLSDEGWEYDPELADLEMVMAAARRVADAPRIWWCESAQTGSRFSRPHWCRGTGHDACGPARLLTDTEGGSKP